MQEGVEHRGPPVEAPMAMSSKGPGRRGGKTVGGGGAARPACARPAPHDLDLGHELDGLDEPGRVELMVGMAGAGRFFQQADRAGIDDIERLADIGGIERWR